VLLGLLVVPEPAVASLRGPDAATTVVSLSGSAAFADDVSELTGVLTTEDGAPLVDAVVVVARRQAGEWQEVASLTTDAVGRFLSTAVLERTPADNVFRADHVGSATAAPSTSGPVQVELRRRSSRVGLDGPATVVDETTVTLEIERVTGSGVAVPGPVRVERRTEGGDWRRYRRVLLGENGSATIGVAPRVDSWWRVVAPSAPWVTGDRSSVHFLDNLPPAPPIRIRRAPDPRLRLPPQRRAVGDGPHAVTTRIPGGVWRQMTGRSWHAGCPVGRAGLRLIRINYWGFDGYRHRGELVVSTATAHPAVRAFSALYRRRFPLRSMYRVDRFGYSSRVHGANDYRSMAAGNTSAFNCRYVVGRPGVRSPHATGRAVDLNTWENPYHSAQGWVPDTWWVGKSHPRVAWRGGGHPVVAIMRGNGFAWTYGVADSQHFDLRGRSGRTSYVPGCVCD
jgi:hypothetical protein